MWRLIAAACLLLPYAASAQPAPTGALVESTVTCGVASTALLTAASATKFILIQNPTGGGAVWFNFTGAAAVAAPPSLVLAGGATISWSPMQGFVPASAINCIAPVAQAVTILYQ
jgi:hypothetical protein